MALPLVEAAGCSIIVNSTAAISNGSVNDGTIQLATHPNYRERSNSESVRRSAKSAGMRQKSGAAASNSRQQSYLSTKASSSMSTSCLSLGEEDKSRMKHSSSTKYGSECHLGSSVTFCNVPGGNELGMSLLTKHDSGLRRSCSITLVYPTENLLSAGNEGRPQEWTGRGLQAGNSRPRSPAMTRAASYRHAAGPLLPPPAITYDRVSSPTWGSQYGEGGFGEQSTFGSSYHLQTRSKAVMVTPRGSFLAVNQSPQEFRESMLSINYPNCGG